MIIYSYRNRLTNKRYIGQTIHPDQRKRNHLHEATKKNSDYYFHRSIRKHGWNNFEYEVLEEVDDRNNLNERENFYIDRYNTIWPNGYNQCRANSLDETAIEKMRNTKKKQFSEMTEDERKKMTAKMCENNKGSKRSKETREKQSRAAKAYLAENPHILRTRRIRKDNTSGHKGVSFNKKTEKWVAFIVIDKKHIHLGTFNNKNDAIFARAKAEIDLKKKRRAEALL